MHQLMAFINTGFTGAFGPLWTALEMENPDPAIQSVLQKTGREAVIERHDRLDDMIGDSQFLVSGHPTLADGVLIGVARWLDFHKVAERSRWPRLNAIRTRIEAEDAVKRATALESGTPVAKAPTCLGHISLSDVIGRYGAAA